MSFQWLEMRIGEERDRRAREKQILDRLPGAMDELEESVKACLDGYTAAFPGDPAAPGRDGLRLGVTGTGGAWRSRLRRSFPDSRSRRRARRSRFRSASCRATNCFISTWPEDRYLSMEELTKRILDRVLFPKLKD